MMNFRLKINNIFLLIPSVRNFSSLLQKDATIVVDHLEYITTIGINRPEKRNCIDRNTAKLLTQAIEDFENDDKARVAVLHGIGGNFCAGMDLEELAEKGQDNKVYASDIKDGTMGPTHRYVKKPLVAAISGYAVGGGLELATMCDLRVMEDTAILGIYSRRYGVPLIDGGTVRLTAILGLSRALDLILTGRALTAKEAFKWGLINRIVSCGTGLGQAINLATCIVKYPQKSLLADRKSAHRAAYKMAYDELLQYEKENAQEAFSTEAMEGAKHFISGLGKHGKSFCLLEKEIPDWELEEEQKS